LAAVPLKALTRRNTGLVSVIDLPATAQITAACLDHPDVKPLVEAAARRPTPPSQRPLR